MCHGCNCAPLPRQLKTMIITEQLIITFLWPAARNLERPWRRWITAANIYKRVRPVRAVIKYTHMDTQIVAFFVRKTLRQQPCPRNTFVFQLPRNRILYNTSSSVPRRSNPASLSAEAIIKLKQHRPRWAWHAQFPSITCAPMWKQHIYIQKIRSFLVHGRLLRDIGARAYKAAEPQSSRCSCVKLLGIRCTLCGNGAVNKIRGWIND